MVVLVKVEKEMVCVVKCGYDFIGHPLHVHPPKGKKMESVKKRVALV